MSELKLEHGLDGLSEGQIFDYFLEQFDDASKDLERCRRNYFAYEYDTDFTDDVDAYVFDCLQSDYEKAEVHYRSACRNLAMFVFANSDLISIECNAFVSPAEMPDLEEEYWKE